jgi:hypothetical protein
LRHLDVVLHLMLESSEGMLVHFAHPLHFMVVEILLKLTGRNFEQLQGIYSIGVLLL